MDKQHKPGAAKQTVMLSSDVVYRRKRIESIAVTYISEDSHGNQKQETATFDGNEYGAIIADPDLKDALHKLMGPRGCYPNEEQPPNSHKRMLMEDVNDNEEAPPECCYYYDGRWYCW